MKHPLALVACLAASVAMAGPTLTAAPYAAGSAPTQAWVMVNGQQRIDCTLPASQSGVTPTCDLSSLAKPGAYKLELFVSNAFTSCTEAPALTWTCTDGGQASSGPFSLTLRAAPAKPLAKLAP